MAEEDPLLEKSVHGSYKESQEGLRESPQQDSPPSRNLNCNWQCKQCIAKPFLILAVLAFTSATIRLVLLIELTRKRFGKDKQHPQSELDDLIGIVSQLCHCFEHIMLICGIWRFHEHLKENTEKVAQSIKQTAISSGKQVVAKVKQLVCQTSHCSKFFCGVLHVLLFAVIGLVTLAYIAISITPPILLTVWRNETLVSYSEAPAIGTMALVMAFISHAYTFMVRIGMIYASLIVRHEWLEHIEIIKNSASLYQLTADKEHSSVKNTKMKFEFLINDYKTAGESVTPIQGIFQAWFVMQWLVYFINSIQDSNLALKMLLNNEGIEHKKELIFTSTHLVYDFIVFIFLYCCGSLMNYYHKQYRKQLAIEQQEVLSQLPVDQYLWILQSANGVIPESTNYQFVPSLGLINIPLDNPGYTLTMLLTVFAFLTNFVTSFAEV